MPLRKVLFLVLSAISLAYPFLVYFGLNYFGPIVFALILFAFLLIRFIVTQQFRQISQWVLLVVVGGFCALVSFFNSAELLRYYPVLMSLGVASLFVWSLTTSTPLIERLAKLAKQEPSAGAKHYMFVLTIVWAVLLVLNAMVAAYTACCLSLQQWTLYNGLISYIIFGFFMVVELIYRRFYKRRFYRAQQTHDVDSIDV